MELPEWLAGRAVRDTGDFWVISTSEEITGARAFIEKYWHLWPAHVQQAVVQASLITFGVRKSFLDNIMVLDSDYRVKAWGDGELSVHLRGGRIP